MKACDPPNEAQMKPRPPLMIARWDPELMASMTGDRSRDASGGLVLDDYSSYSEAIGHFADRAGLEAFRPKSCVEANSASWLTGFTFGPLLGIFFHQRKFSRWKASLKLPSRVKALPEKTRYLLPALAPCIGGALTLLALALLVMLEMGIRGLRCDRVGPHLGKCSWCGAVARCLCKTSKGAARGLGGQGGGATSRAGRRPVCHAALELAPELSPLLGHRADEGSESDGNSVKSGYSERERFLTARDDDPGASMDASESSDDGATGDEECQGPRRPRGSTGSQELDLSYSKPIASGVGKERSLSMTAEDMASDARFPDFEKAFGRRAAEKFLQMLEWRRANGVDVVMATKHPKFFVFKRSYPFYVHGRSRTGEIVTYENPGKMKLSQAREAGCTPAALRGILR